MGEYESLARLPRARLAGHGRRRRRGRRRGLHHDAALRQGAGVRHRLSCPAGRKGSSRSSARIDESGRAGLEEERRLAYVGLTRARKRAKIWFVANRRMHGLWQSTMPSRFLDELPEDACRGRPSRRAMAATAPAAWAATAPPASTTWSRSTPPTARPAGSARRPTATPPTRARRAERQPLHDRGRAGGARASSAARRASPPATASSTRNSAPGTVAAVDGNKLTVDFDKAGQKRVVDSFVEAA